MYIYSKILHISYINIYIYQATTIIYKMSAILYSTKHFNSIIYITTYRMTNIHKNKPSHCLCTLRGLVYKNCQHLIHLNKFVSITNLL